MLHPFTIKKTPLEGLLFFPGLPLYLTFTIHKVKLIDLHFHYFSPSCNSSFVFSSLNNTAYLSLTQIAAVHLVVIFTPSVSLFSSYSIVLDH